MTTTLSVVYTDAGVSYKPNIFQFRSFFDKIYDILKINTFTCSCWASVEKELLWRCVSRSRFQIHQIHDRFTFATIKNSAVYLTGARVSIFPTLVPRLLGASSTEMVNYL